MYAHMYAYVYLFFIASRDIYVFVFVFVCVCHCHWICFGVVWFVGRQFVCCICVLNGFVCYCIGAGTGLGNLYT
jgi:hypothetical protein